MGCWSSRQRSLLNEGLKALDKQQYEEAEEHFTKLIKYRPHSQEALIAARKASQVHFEQTKNYMRAINYYRHLVFFSLNKKEKKESQRQIATIYFYKVSDYKSAIEAYQNLLIFSNSQKEVFQIYFSIAKAYFYLNQFFQAEVEVKEILKMNLNKTDIFNVKKLLGQIYLNNEKTDKAIEVYKELIAQHPILSHQEKLRMNLALFYEEKKEFVLAIKELEKMREQSSDKEFVDIKIKRLKFQQANQPGYRGIKNEL